MIACRTIQCTRPETLWRFSHQPNFEQNVAFANFSIASPAGDQYVRLNNGAGPEQLVCK